MNHDFLIRELVHPDEIRAVYLEIEDILDWDYHYWLQRGSFEVERGSSSAARNFLGQARSLAPQEMTVQTEWGYMLLVEATEHAKAGLSTHVEIAQEAIEVLADVIARRGKDTPYPFHVLAIQGLSWVSEASLGRTDAARYLGEILATVRDGRRLHPGSSELRTVEQNVENAYLMLAAM